MATVAVFLALSGAGAYAAKKVRLAANSVLSSHIRNGQVTSVDIANGAIGSSKLAAGAVTTEGLADGAVTGGQVFDGTLSGLDMGPDSLGPDEIDEASLGVVPNATNATSAGTAGTADNADNAGTVNDVEVQSFRFRKDNGDDADVQLLNLGGLVLTAKCATGGTPGNDGEEMTVTASTTGTDDATLIGSFDYFSGSPRFVRDNFTTANPTVITGTGSDAASDANQVQGTLTYARYTGSEASIVTVVYGGDEDVLSGKLTACVFAGTAFQRSL